MKKILIILSLMFTLFLCGCNSSEYKQALSFLENGEYESALEIFEKLEEKGYKDSSEKIDETKYQQALSFLENGEYKSALEIFEKLKEKGYKDSSEKIDETKYKHAVSLSENEKYESALKIFEELAEKNYKDSVENMLDLKHKKFVSAINEKDFETATALIEELEAKNYKKIDEIKYLFVINNKDEEDTTVYKYLEELISIDYEDSKKIYDELYSWNIEIAFNTSRKKLSHQNIVNASNKVFHNYFINFRITGGKPGEELHGRYVISYPDGQESSAGFGDGGGLILTLMCNGSGSLLGKTEICFYDDDGFLLGKKSATIK